MLFPKRKALGLEGCSADVYLSCSHSRPGFHLLSSPTNHPLLTHDPSASFFSFSALSAFGGQSAHMHLFMEHGCLRPPRDSSHSPIIQLCFYLSAPYPTLGDLLPSPPARDLVCLVPSSATERPPEIASHKSMRRTNEWQWSIQQNLVT